MQYSLNTEDRFCRISGPNIGTIDGPSVERHLFTAGTGVGLGRGRVGARRQPRLHPGARHGHAPLGPRPRHGRGLVLPSFEYLENWTNPLLGQRYALDREQFTPVMDEYYALQGWDPRTGWPTAEHMAELGMGDDGRADGRGCGPRSRKGVTATRCGCARDRAVSGKDVRRR